MKNPLAFLNASPTANLIAKAFLVGYGGQAAFTFGPMLGDPGALLLAMTHPAWDYAFFNDALGKACVAAWALVLSNPFEEMAPPTVTLTRVPLRPVDLQDK